MELRAAPGWIIDVGADREQVIRVVSFERRNVAINRWMLQVVGPIGLVDECWAEFDRATEGVGPLLLAAWFVGEPGLEVKRLVSAGTLSRDPREELLNRPQQHGWIPGGMGLASVAWFVILSRRRETALYTAVGLSRPGLVMLVGVEFLLVVGVAWVAGILIATGVMYASGATLSGDQVLMGAVTSGSAALLASISIPILVVVGSGSAIAQALKET
ncbi:MAG: FtsX-like permease family protein [Chloroflexota bacterium]